MEFGSTQGGWVYPLLEGPSARPYLLLALLLPGLLYFLHLTHKYLHTHERTVVASWLVGGFVFQACLHALSPYSLGAIVASEQANAFYGVTLQQDAGQLLRDFHAAAGNLPLHAKANMPGKILLFYLLELATKSPQTLGYLIMLLSDFGGVLVYLVVRKLFADRASDDCLRTPPSQPPGGNAPNRPAAAERSHAKRRNERLCRICAIYAMILYLLIPAKTFFFPLLNTVTPVFALVSLLLLLLYLESGRRAYLVLEGASLYVLVLFEPLPLVLGLVFLALLVRSYWQGRLSKIDLALVVAMVAGSFFLCHALMVRVFGFDVVRAFLFAWNDARTFNAEMGRPYSVWVVHNLKDFLLNAGMFQSALFLALAGYLVGKLLWLCRPVTRVVSTAAADPARVSAVRGQRVKAFLNEPQTLLTLSFLAVLLFTDLAGVNRGETVRLWIFLAVFVQIIAAHCCAAKAGRWAFTALVMVTVFQTAVTISQVGFVIP
jgi:hypothetical protein